jgi:hypothetical protein
MSWQIGKRTPAKADKENHSIEIFQRDDWGNEK